jgi:repressor LexA
VVVDGREPYVPQTGDYVVSSIEGVANIKRFVRDDVNQQIVLMSESTDEYPPIVIHPDDYLAQSKVIQVVKQPKIS